MNQNQKYFFAIAHLLQEKSFQLVYILPDRVCVKYVGGRVSHWTIKITDGDVLLVAYDDVPHSIGIDPFNIELCVLSPTLIDSILNHVRDCDKIIEIELAKLTKLLNNEFEF